MLRAILRTVTFLLSLVLISHIALAQDWTQWRGEHRDGVVSTFTAPAVWPETLKRKWKTPVGSGYSSPIVAQGKIYLHSRQEEQEMVSCFDLSTGKMVWSKSYPA